MEIKDLISEKTIKELQALAEKQESKKDTNINPSLNPTKIEAQNHQTLQK